MAITSLAVDEEFIYEMSTAPAGIIKNKLNTSSRHQLTLPPGNGDPIEITTSDEHLFALLSSGEIWRQYRYSSTWHHMVGIFGITHISTSPTHIYLLNGGTNTLQRMPLPGDYGLETLNTGGLLSPMVQTVADEGSLMVLLANGDTVIQKELKRFSANFEVLERPVNTSAIEIGEEFAYFRNAEGEIFRSKDYSLSGVEKLDGVTGVTVMAISSDHKDTLFYIAGGIRGSVTPGTWFSSGVDSGWVEGGTVLGGLNGWVLENSWVQTGVA